MPCSVKVRNFPNILKRVLDDIKCSNISEWTTSKGWFLASAHEVRPDLPISGPPGIGMVIVKEWTSHLRSL
jgi:hypothetical protein